MSRKFSHWLWWGGVTSEYYPTVEASESSLRVPGCGEKRSRFHETMHILVPFV